MNSPTARPLATEPDSPDRASDDTAPPRQARRPLAAPPIAALVQRKPGDEAPKTAMPDVKADVRHVNFFYGKFQALHDISVPLYDRRVTAFIGPSGCGKSTLLRILNRIYELYPGQTATGEVILDGARVPAENRATNSCSCSRLFILSAFSDSMRLRTCAFARTMSS